MERLDFLARLPADAIGKQRLFEVMNWFSTTRQLIQDQGTPATLADEELEDVCAKANTDRFMVEDILRVVNGSVQPPSRDFLERGCWSLGRKRPRFGAPWANLHFTDPPKTMVFMVRYGGRFDDDEDPPIWVGCQAIVPNQDEYESMVNRVSSFDIVDYWWIVEGERVRVTLALRQY